MKFEIQFVSLNLSLSLALSPFPLDMSDAPPGWEVRISKSHGGKAYYFNPSTKESTWERPMAADQPQVRCTHLLVKHAGSRRPSSWRQDVITRSKEEAMQLIQEYRRRVVAGEVDLGTLASTESDCSSAKKKGDLGFFGRKQMQAAFEEASFALQVGELSEPVVTDSGVHLILRTA